MIYIILFFQFFKYGLLCFGGGYMIIPLLYTDFVEVENFFTPECYGNLLSVSQMTPGPVSINTATYVGYMKAEIFGALSATLGLCTPTFILATIVLKFLYVHKDKPIIDGFFKGAKWAAFLMILSSVWLFAKISILEQSVSITDILTSMKSGIIPKINIHFGELLIASMTILLAKKIPFTILLLLSAIIGVIVSYL